MAGQKRVTHEWADRLFVPGGTELVELPIGLDVESIQIYMRGSINVTTAFAGIKSEGLAKLIDRVELLSNGKLIATVPFTMVVNGNFARHALPISVMPGIAVGNYTNVKATGFLDLSAIGCLRPKDSNLSTLGLRNLQLRLRYNQLTDMYIGAGVATAALSTQIVVRETSETAQGKLPTLLHKHDFDEKVYAASTVDRLPLTSQSLSRAIVLRAESGGDLSTAVLNRVKVQVGTEFVFDASAQAIVDSNFCDNDGTAFPAGYYVIDFAPQASGLSKVTDFLDLQGRSDAFLILDVNGGVGNKVQMVKHNFEWLPDHIEANAAATPKSN